jgi:hypothetical protein
VLIFVVARSRLDRYDELREQFGDWRDVRIVLDRREGERRTAQPTFAGLDRRRVERRHRQPALDPGAPPSGWLRGLDLNQRPLGYESEET